MIGSVEFAVAVAVGWAFLGDALNALQIAGIGLVLAAAVVAGRSSPPDAVSRTGVPTTVPTTPVVA